MAFRDKVETSNRQSQRWNSWFCKMRWDNFIKSKTHIDAFQESRNILEFNCSLPRRNPERAGSILHTPIPTPSFIFHQISCSPPWQAAHFLNPFFVSFVASLHVFRKLSVKYWILVHVKGCTQMLGHKEEEGSRSYICNAYVQPQKWIVTRQVRVGSLASGT